MLCNVHREGRGPAEVQARHALASAGVAWTRAVTGGHTCLRKPGSSAASSQTPGASCSSHGDHGTFSPGVVSIFDSKRLSNPGPQVTSPGRWSQGVTQTGLQT